MTGPASVLQRPGSTSGRDALGPAAEAARSFWSLVRDDAGALVLSLLLLALLVGLAELLHRRMGWSSRVTRRLVHAATGLYVVAIPYLFSAAPAVYLLGAIFVLVNGLTSARGWLRGMHPEDLPSRGTVAFPLALLAILPFCWGAERIYILQTAFLVLAIADPLAAVVGESSPGGRVRIGTAVKSAAGSLTFFVTAWALILAGLVLFGASSPAGTPATVLLHSGLAALVATAVEALGGRGWDNFFVVVVTALLLLLGGAHPEWLSVMGIGVAVGVLFGLFAWRMEYLSHSGAIAGGLFAATLIGIGGWGWIAPGFTFFFLSSALSKWADRIGGSRVGAEARESRRDATQVYANGGVAWLLVVAYALEPRTWIYWGFVGSLAAATADTWATEVGPLFRQQPRMILSRRPVPAGTSGAVTRAGTLAGALGAVVVWASAWWTAPEAVRGVAMTISAAVVVGGGLVGSLIDSLAGATVQAVYRDPGTGRMLDGRVGGETGLERVRGWRWIDNDVVNVMCTAVGAAVSMLAIAATPGAGP